MVYTSCRPFSAVTEREMGLWARLYRATVPKMTCTLGNRLEIDESLSYGLTERNERPSETRSGSGGAGKV